MLERVAAGVVLVESVVLFCWWYGCLSVVVGGGANIGLVVLMSSYPEECLFRQDIHLIRPGGSLSLSEGYNVGKSVKSVNSPACR